MKNAFLVHSTGGSPAETFYPWLAGELRKLGYAVEIPQFPTPEGQNLESWMDVAEPYLPAFGEGTLLLGRSIGGPFVLRLLERVEKPVDAAFIVAGFCSGPVSPEFKPLVDSFIEKPFDWRKIRESAKNFFVYHSDDDPFLPLSRGEELARNLGVELTFVPRAGHFWMERFPRLLQDVKGLR